MKTMNYQNRKRCITLAYRLARESNKSKRWEFYFTFVLRAKHKFFKFGPAASLYRYARCYDDRVKKTTDNKTAIFRPIRT